MLYWLGELIARELLQPRVLPRPVAWIGRAIACVLVAWGAAVCVVTIGAVLSAIIGYW